jgi:hypothetical protein
MMRNLEKLNDACLKKPEVPTTINGALVMVANS